MSIHTSKPPDYVVLVEKLIELSAAGKLSWKSMASDDMYLATVKGIETYTIQRFTLDPRQAEVPYSYFLMVRGKNGEQLYSYAEDGGLLEKLFDVAQRIALHSDEKVKASLQLLNNL